MRAETPQAAPARRGAGGKRVVVIGSGVGGYTAAFRAADLGLEVTLVERDETLGGVCLNVGCIPSKARAPRGAGASPRPRRPASFGIKFADPKIDLDELRGWKDEVVGKLTGGLDGLAKQRKVNVVRGDGQVHVRPTRSTSTATEIEFDHAIIAAGSRAMVLPGLPDDERIVDSTGALELAGHPRAPAGDRRRDHRPRDGGHVLGARQQGSPWSS